MDTEPTVEPVVRRGPITQMCLVSIALFVLLSGCFKAFLRHVQPVAGAHISEHHCSIFCLMASRTWRVLASFSPCVP